MKLSFNNTLTAILTLLALTFSAIMVIPAHAASLVVNSLTDTTAVDGNCTLREAITNANANSDTTGGDCAAGSGADTITFSVSGIITLSSTLPNITDAAGLTMDGTGRTVTVSGGNAVRVLNVNTGASLTLNNLTIANGKIFAGDHGGGISNAGTLAITNSTFSGNSTTTGYGGGIINNGTGTLTVTNSTFSGNSAPSAGGGGIFNMGTLTVTNSTISGNSATSFANGGGIYNNSGTATITNSFFSVNSATNWGGGIFINDGAVTVTNSTFSGNSAYYGGGIFNLGTLTITNNTFSGNSSSPSGGPVGGGPGGGGIYNYGALTITNSTFSGNSASPGGGIYNDGASGGTATLLNTIVTNSTGGNCYGTITNGGNNIDDGTTCGLTYANGSMSSTNPLLGALANNGGPTQTFALLTGSPAIDGVTFNAPNSAPSTDQRGVTRPQGVRYDIGAVEIAPQSGSNFVVNALADTDDTVCENAPGNCTLREAINAANAFAGANTITFSISGTITLGSQLPNITAASGALTIDGAGQTMTISGGNAVRVLVVNGGASLTLNNLTIANGNSTFSGGGSGGGIASSGTLTISNGTFTANTAPADTGGGVYIYAGAATIANSTFSGNSAIFGGGVFTSGGATLTITNSTFSGNSNTAAGGGGIFNYDGTVTLRNTIVANSTSGGNCSGTITNGGNNIDDGTTCGWGSTNGSKSSTPPLLGALANNGGSTQTFALLTGSPAIDGVTFNEPNNAPSTDQRGVARPQGARYDIGAYEFLENTPKKVGLPWLLLLLGN